MRERVLPLRPLIEAYRATVSESGPTPLVTACAEATADWLNPGFLDSADDRALAEKLVAFYTAVQPVPFHSTAITCRVRFVRYAINHLLRGHDPLPDRLARCATPGKVYAVPGLGLTFWSAVVKAINPDRNPLWCPATDAGLKRLGILPMLPDCIAPRFEGVQHGYRVLGEMAPDLTAWQLDDFLARVGRMAGRELPTEPLDASVWSWTPDPERIREAVREVRVRTPLRKRLREAAVQTTTALVRFQAALRAGECEAATAAYRATVPDGRWEVTLPRLDDAYSPALPLADRSRLWCETAAVLREHFRVHPLELADVVLTTTPRGEAADTHHPGFGGFCTDTFRVLTELASATSKEWMAAHREWYQFALREPLVELCEALAARYIRPVLDGEYGWEMESDSKPGRALTSICKNDYGRSGPYQPVQWVTFYRRSQAHRRADAQFFVRVAADGVRFGFHLGRSARDAGKQFRHNLQKHGEAIHAALAAGEVFGECRFWTGDDLAGETPVRTAADLRHWATYKTIGVGKHLPPDAPLLRRDELVGEILLTFDRLVPAFGCAAEADPRPLLARRAGTPPGQPPFDRGAFIRETFLSDLWLDRVLGLLRLKKQLVLQGVPGTGKTHVARCLARLLTHDRPDCTRLVQFHPSYSYEEFVEGIRVRSVEVNGRNEVAYPVEDGVLAAFAEQATRRPSEPHVLVIDELNRGNLPRVFGELLYLLEYREQAITLPYSKRSFRLPDNLFVVATMNAADRSAVALDQALRRRFSFVDMTPDSALLARWLDQNPPADPDETFGPRAVRAFEELNRRLARDLGPEKQVGHSLFMVPDLDTPKLAAVWEHHVRPLLLDYFGGRAERLAGYNLGKLACGEPKAKRQPNPVGG